MSDLKEARRRSVDNLQRLYTFVVGLAVTESLRRTLSPLATDYAQWLIFTSFIVTVVPFYHGANLYLDATYVTSERVTKRHALMLDFVILFIQGLLLFALALQVNSRQHFYTLLAVLFVFDAVWVGITHLTVERDSGHTAYTQWAVVNLIAAAALLAGVWSAPLLRMGEVVQNLLLVAFATGRTVYDYVSVWQFYYPASADVRYDNIPAPRPAPKPSTARRAT